MGKANRETTGILFNIQKFSVHDGPGIRTVVFFKGCPLKCRWCSNPESQLPKIQVLWDRTKCARCLHCVNTCPTGAIQFCQGDIRIHPGRCTGCGGCVQGCPNKALETAGGVKSVQQVLDVVMQDLVFYEESGGGITLSGGEFLQQPDFAEALLLAAHEEGLHTCCETTGFAKPEVFTRVMTHVDHILFDVKHHNPDAHRAATGVSNDLIFHNLAQAIAMGKPVLPRIPVIPGFNASREDATGLCRVLKEVGAKRCQLLPFHQFGEKKYDLLNTVYAYTDVPALHPEELEGYVGVFRENGIDAFF